MARHISHREILPVKCSIICYPLATPLHNHSFLHQLRQEEGKFQDLRISVVDKGVSRSVCVLNHVQLLVTPWTTVHQAPVHGIFQARILEWVAISFSRGSSWPRDQTHISCVSCIASRFFTHWAIREVKDKGVGPPRSGPLPPSWWTLSRSHSTQLELEHQPHLPPPPRPKE